MSDVVQRVNGIMAVLAVIGIVAAGAFWGVAGAVGFAGGCVVSFLNFRWMSRMVLAIGAPEADSKKRLPLVLLSGRYLLFAAIGYVIFRYSQVGFLAALAGCFIQIAAVILEAFYELIYAGTP